MSENDKPAGEGEDPSVSGVGKFVKYFKEWKEAILLILFAVGGSIWLYSAFVTKQDLRITRCLLNNYILVVASQVSQKISNDELISIRQKIRELKRNSKNLSDSQARELDQLEINEQKQVDLLKKAQSNANMAFETLQRGECIQ